MLYQRIKDFREDKDLTQTQMAKILGVSQSTYSRYELGVLDVPTDILIKLAKFHQTSVDYLLDCACLFSKRNTDTISNIAKA